jgi:hypothetical protein
MGLQTYNLLVLALEDSGLMNKKSHEKYVPEVYKRGSVAQRIALLQGLMDTGGSVGNGTHATFTSTSERLAGDVQEIAWSLGAIASISPRQTHYTHNGTRCRGRPSWRVSIVHPDVSCMFSLPRKVAKCTPKEMQHRLKIASIEPVGRKHAVCIAVGHPDGLYVTDNYIVTHNTTMLKTIVSVIEPNERIITIENALELDIVNQPNHVRLLYSHGGQGVARVTQKDLLEAYLRMRPDRGCVGELRDPEAAYTYVSECMTGHPGSPSTIHGRDAPQAATRLFNLFRASESGKAYSDDMIIAQLGLAVDVIVPFREKNGTYEIGEVWLAPDAERRGKDFRELLEG